MFSIKNIEKFVNDNPELSGQKDELMKKAQGLTEDGNLMVAMTAEMVLGPKWGKKFLNLISTDLDHIEIAMKSGMANK
ncbi:MAG TPA: hypothetical protein ENH35_04125 [Candidatus Moranbacteria bacterium]|nr:hypothetical protein [Candidatus Moranbacteria bacterium]